MHAKQTTGTSLGFYCDRGRDSLGRTAWGRQQVVQPRSSPPRTGHCEIRPAPVHPRQGMPVKRIVTGCVRLVVADAAVQSRLRAHVDETHPIQPIRQGPAGTAPSRPALDVVALAYRLQVNSVAVCTQSHMARLHGVRGGMIRGATLAAARTKPKQAQTGHHRTVEAGSLTGQKRSV